MKALIDHITAMSIVQKMLMNPRCTRIAEQETKIEQMESDLEDTIEKNSDEKRQNLSDNDEKFESKFRMPLKLYSNPYISPILSSIAGDLNVCSQITTMIR